MRQVTAKGFGLNLAGILLLVCFISACQVPEPKDPNPQKMPAQAMTINPDGKSQKIVVKIDHGYQPAHIVAKAGIPMEIHFFRNEQVPSCAKDVVVSKLNEKFSVTNQSTYILKVPAQKPGQIPIECSMAMMHAVVDVQ